VPMQVAIYAGLPAANAAFRVAKDEREHSERPGRKGADKAAVFRRSDRTVTLRSSPLNFEPRRASW
jgi:hypothetical protein